ncbi:Chlorophyllase enzyme [Micromonospora pattaloongensis]|uniref:Chlorophyllase enzyme n=1 Tax=Micromonospora pattaloongensis TaxID=405436 RepID=A0A1H3FZ43_9ACTN|nr:chlorophyllase [Micromonospora pattaloongensis]SDX96246.1 Chlorophyllase enzyme [Micromonospora pattaloongensis]
MCRAPLAAVLAAVLAGGVLTGCSARDAGQAGPTATPAPTTRPSSARTPPPADRTAPATALAVGTRRLALTRGADRPLPVTIWYPARGAAGDEPRAGAPVAAGRFPVALFSHGLHGRPEDYAPLLARWAAAGFVVAAPAYPHTARDVARFEVFDVVNQPADAAHVLTAVLGLDKAARDPLRGHLDTERVAAAGHSAGGITTVGLFTAARDPRLDAGIVLAGSALGVGTAFSGAAAPQLFVHGERDDVVSHAAGRAAYDAVPWPKAMLSLPGADHGGSLLRSDNPLFTVVADTTVEFLRWTLYGDRAAKRRLPAAATRGGLGVLENRL